VSAVAFGSTDIGTFGANGFYGDDPVVIQRHVTYLRLLCGPLIGWRVNGFQDDDRVVRFSS